MRTAVVLGLLFTLLLSLPARAQQTLPGFEPYFGKTPEGWLTLRRWRADSAWSYLIFNPKTLRTSQYEGRPVQPLTPLGWQLATAGTPYGLAMAVERMRGGSLQDAGIGRTDTTERGFSLTVDLCPSSKPLDRAFFTNLIAAFDQEERPIPVSISLTGVWMAQHKEDLTWLRSLQAKRQLSITWVNHTYHHHFDPAAPLTRNFALMPGTDLRSEILLQEQAMLGVVYRPSVFFRFPGLVSDQDAFNTVLELGLLPIGSDAWLAKGQKPKDGSLVLVHANGNEPQGLEDFYRLIKTKSGEIRQRRYMLYDLGESLGK